MEAAEAEDVTESLLTWSISLSRIATPGETETLLMPRSWRRGSRLRGNGQGKQRLLCRKRVSGETEAKSAHPADNGHRLLTSLL